MNPIEEAKIPRNIRNYSTFYEKADKIENIVAIIPPIINGFLLPILSATFNIFN